MPQKLSNFNAVLATTFRPRVPHSFFSVSCTIQCSTCRVRYPAASPYLSSQNPSPQARPSRPPTRAFSTFPPLLKNKRDGEKGNKRSPNDAATNPATELDPFDFSELEAGIQRALERLKDELSKLRAGGRFNPDIVEALRVSLTKGSKETVRLGDLAQVVPRGGRTVVVLVGEKDHVKPISSAILASPHSLNPTPSPHSPLELTISIPPPTQESRLQALTSASKAGETASHAVRQARGAQQKKLRAMSLTKKVGPDDLKKAGTKMEKVVEGGNAEVKKVVEGARRVLEQG